MVNVRARNGWMALIVPVLMLVLFAGWASPAFAAESNGDDSAPSDALLESADYEARSNLADTASSVAPEDTSDGPATSGAAGEASKGAPNAGASENASPTETAATGTEDNARSQGVETKTASDPQATSASAEGQGSSSAAASVQPPSAKSGEAAPPASSAPNETKTADASRSTAAQPAAKTASAKKAASASKATASAKAASSSAPVADGNYVIVSSKKANAVLDVAGASKSNGAVIEFYKWNAGDNQRWALVADADGRYLIQGVQSGKVLTVEGGKAAATAAIVLGTDRGRAAQRWTLTKSGLYYIVHSALDERFVLGSVRGEVSDGIKVKLYKEGSDRAQKLYFVPLKSPKVECGRTLADGVYTLGMAASSKQKVDVEGASTKKGANVLAWRDNGGHNQWWQISHYKNGLYRIQSVESGLYLDISGASVLACSNVIQWSANKKASANQLWAVQKNADGTYSFISKLSGMALEVKGASTDNGANVRVYYRNASAAAQKFVLDKPELLPNGTYRIFSKMAQTSKGIDIAGVSLANKARAIIWDAADGPNQHFIVRKHGDAYSLRAVSSGKYLTARNGNVVQMSYAAKGKGQAPAQLWKVTYASGYVFRNVADGNVLDVAGASAKNGAKLITWKWTGGANQKYRVQKCALLSNGLYTIASAANTANMLDVSGGRYKDGTNVALWKANDGNNQKFWISAAGGGKYRIAMPFGDQLVEVKGASKKAANVDTWHTNGGENQLWKAQVTDGGIVFINSNSGMVLAAGGKAAKGANVSQAKRTDVATQKWVVGTTGLNFADTSSFINAMRTASGGYLHVSNAVAGWKPKSGDWKELQNAINSCGFGLGFLLTDCNTGTVISYNPDETFYGASTIKALWVTYLFEEYIAKGRLSWGSISGLAVPTIANSNNETYISLRSQYGSESGFGSWLNSVGVGYVGRWGYFTPRELQQAWTHMLAYSNSSKTGVGAWKSTFNHSYFSVVHDELGGYRTTYSKPGWMGPWNNPGPILNDSAVVVGAGGNQYLLTLMSSANGFGGQKGQLQRVVRALDRIQADMPSCR